MYFISSLTRGNQNLLQPLIWTTRGSEKRLCSREGCELQEAQRSCSVPEKDVTTIGSETVLCSRERCELQEAQRSCSVPEKDLNYKRLRDAALFSRRMWTTRGSETVLCSREGCEQQEAQRHCSVLGEDVNYKRLRRLRSCLFVMHKPLSSRKDKRVIGSLQSPRSCV